MSLCRCGLWCFPYLTVSFAPAVLSSQASSLGYPRPLALAYAPSESTPRAASPLANCAVRVPVVALTSYVWRLWSFPARCSLLHSFTPYCPSLALLLKLDCDIAPRQRLASSGSRVASQRLTAVATVPRGTTVSLGLCPQHPMCAPRASSPWLALPPAQFVLLVRCLGCVQFLCLKPRVVFWGGGMFCVRV